MRVELALKWLKETSPPGKQKGAPLAVVDEGPEIAYADARQEARTWCAPLAMTAGIKRISQVLIYDELQMNAKFISRTISPVRLGDSIAKFGFVMDNGKWRISQSGVYPFLNG